MEAVREEGLGIALVDLPVGARARLRRGGVVEIDGGAFEEEALVAHPDEQGA